MMRLCIVTPSYISSHERSKFAVRSLESLRAATDQPYDHVVVDDWPRLSLPIPGNRSVKLPIPDPFWIDAATTVYDEPHTDTVRRVRGDSVSATLRGVREARKRGSDLVFLHLDDNIYVPQMGRLLEYARDAFTNDNTLQHVQLSGAPMLSDDCTPEEGNRSLIEIDDDGNAVVFDDITFRPDRADEYTLWSAPFGESMLSERFWPVVGWSSVFRIDFLEWLLTREGVTDLPNLGQWEVYYRRSENWERVMDYGGRLGYINMQFGGLEMHHNQNWRELLSYPNEPVR